MQLLHRPVNNMKTVSRYFLYIVFFTCFSCVHTGFVEYIPLVTEEGGFYEARDMITPEHLQNLKQVLDYYHEIWEDKNGRIYISNAISQELVWNYTTKANDKIWLAKHTK